ncbi:amino acid ABC transporter substrate-binding protein, PAAT family [Blastococcus sp. DSM 46786]|uniref:transporter substrate-binding domain-containing protein n=1 Tax=Blastococcus sp. DSM 46786 TaxID=1798227 RepID=UPI0008C67F9F|nr:transporter substrate-binding domain-containing protein [Blastococcus sp. DSM 46786]SEK98722.1 amino acid ABC transporter substrate-binding protein, PAAT family [Blastococcus sp. DSM 46786]
MTFRRTALVATLSVVALTAAACGGGDEETATDVPVAEAPEFEAGTTMAELAEAGSMTVGTKYDQPFFGLEGLGGELEGFDVEIAKIIAAELGIAPEDIDWEETPSSVREEVIEGGEVDMVVATYTINAERAERITFAGPYYEAGQQIMVLSENDEITGPEYFTENPDATICSVRGSTPSEQIRPYLANEGQLTLFDEYSQCADSLSTGQVDAVTTDNVILLGFVSESDGEFKLVGEQFTEEPYGIGIEKGDVEFCQFINETLAANEEAYVAAWEATAGQIEGTQTPELPEPNECV